MGTLGVNVAVFHDGRILLTEREDYHVWCMPGGHIDATPSDFYIRYITPVEAGDSGLEVGPDSTSVAPSRS